MARAKDRARPFARKHLRYWMTAAGGMVVIMVLNTLIGFWIYGERSTPTRVPDYHPIPPSNFEAVVDAGASLDAASGPVQDDATLR